jgi:hypothetical protein
MTITARASALLALTASKRARASMHVASFKRIQSQLGDSVAAWAYADKGIGPGLRAPCATGSMLYNWKPNAGDWCRVAVGLQGTGKSVAAARYVAERGGMLVAATAADNWGFGGGAELVKAKEAPWLLIDDFGETKTRPGDGNLGTLIVDRYARRARCFTVITMAMSAEDLQARYGDNVYDRLRPHIYGFFKRETESLRSADPPIMSGYHRETQIEWSGRKVEHAAHGIIDGADALDAMAMLADVCDIDLHGEAIATEIARRAAEVASMEAMATELLATLAAAAARPVLSVVPQRDDVDAWLDSMDPADLEATK